MTLKAPPAQAQSLARHDAVHATRLRADGVTIAGITGRDRLTRSTLYRHLTVREPNPSPAAAPPTSSLGPVTGQGLRVMRARVADTDPSAGCQTVTFGGR